MTRILPSGIEAKTGYTPPPPLAPGRSSAERHFVELGDAVNPFVGSGGEKPQTGMLDAVFALGTAFQSEVLMKDPFFCKFKEWLATFELKVVRWELDTNDVEKESYFPVLRFKGAKLEEDLVYNFDDPGPSIEVLDHQLSRNDLLVFTHYLMTNSGPEGPEDPRYAFIESLRN